MWVSRSEFEKLKEKVADIEDAAYISSWDAICERSVKTPVSKLLDKLMGALGAYASCKWNGEQLTVTIPAQGISRHHGASNKPVVFTHSEALELLLKHLEVDLVKTPATPEAATLVPRKQSANNES